MPDKKNKMPDRKYLFGPVPSRRLGLSLGVDIVPLKACTLDCIYCQLGKSSQKTIQRKSYVPVETVLKELIERIKLGLHADYITMSGSGEPTLNADLGNLITGIKEITDIPVAVLTNGTLLYDASVRRDCAKADVVLPSLDAADEHTFQKINRPHCSLNLEKLIDGLIAFRKDYPGRIWLEVFLIEGLNTDAQQIARISAIIKRIAPDKVQLNTAVRPTTEAGIKMVAHDKLADIAVQLGGNAEVIADFEALGLESVGRTDRENLLEMLKRRPCSLDDICAGLGISRNEALKHLGYLQQQAIISTENRDGKIFYFVP